MPRTTSPSFTLPPSLKHVIDVDSSFPANKIMLEEEDIYGDDGRGPQHVQHFLSNSPREEQDETGASCIHTCLKLNRRRYHDFLMISRNCYKLIVDLIQSCNVEIGD